MIKALTNRRAVTDEIMDSPGIDAASHLQALAGLRRINRFSHADDRMVKPIAELMRRKRLDEIRLLDVACGGGDVPIGVATAAKRRGLRIDLTFFDRSPTAVTQATTAAAEAGFICQGIVGDALDQLPRGTFDVVTSSLFLHHLPEPNQVIDLLRNMKELAGRMVVISDLRRCRRGYVAAWVGCRLLSRSSIVHFDGPASVRAAWTLGELSGFAAAAGMDQARIERCSPWRMLLVWEKQ